MEIFRFTNALRALGRPSQDRSQASKSVVTREKLVVEDIEAYVQAADLILNVGHDVIDAQVNAVLIVLIRSQGVNKDE